MRHRLASALIVAATIGGAVASEQSGQTPPPTPPRADGVISGMVIDGVTKQPIADAIVRIGWPTRADYPESSEYSTSQFTDTKGRFFFTGLPARPGYAVNATKSGYFDNAFGSPDVEGAGYPVIALADGEWMSSANITLWPPASISGVVTDERGEPLIDVFVRVLSQVRVGAADRWAVGSPVLTDDRGMYRVSLLYPGTYTVMVPSVQVSAPATATVVVDPMVDVDSATRLVVKGYPVPPPPVAGRAFTYPITFAGGTLLAQATLVALKAGEDRIGVDIRLEPVPASRVSGVVAGPPDVRVNLALRLLADGLDNLGLGSEAATTLTGPDGTFVFANVPAGQYTVEAPTGLNEYTLRGMSHFSVFYTPRLPNSSGLKGGNLGGLTAVPGLGFTYSLSSAKWWARVPIVVGARDVSDIVVTLQPTIRISGRMIGEAAPGLPEPSTAPRVVQLQSATGAARQGTPSSRSATGGEFAVEGLVPGAFLFCSEDPLWMIKSVVANGRDCTFTPIELSSGQDVSDVVVTFTNASPTLAGAVSSDLGPAVSAGVLAFPVEQQQWTNYGLRPVRIRTTGTGTNGTFRFRGLPAGDYYVVAAPGTRLSTWMEPGFLQRAAAVATRTTISWGQVTNVSLRLTDVR